jgi:MFS family permease
MFSILKHRDYRLLWAGQSISQLGDQFHLIALPWLVLTITRDPVQLGIVLALAGVPRALLMLLGGAFADRHSPRTIMLVSDSLRFGIVAGLAAAVLTGQVRL